MKNLRLATGRVHRHRNTGFTLVELLVVIAIISLLAAMALVGIPGIIGKAKSTACRNNLKGLFVGLQLYQSEFKEYPSGEEFMGKKFWEALRALPTPATAVMHDKEWKTFICPLTKDKPSLGVCSYRGPNYEFSDTIRGNTPLAADMPANHGALKDSPSVNVLYSGGAIGEAAYNSQDWNEVEENLQE
jgi:prepilin-type N-terminal cleavage/methylation domain-containing protein